MSLFLQLKKFPVLISDVWSLKAYQNIISVKPTMNNKTPNHVSFIKATHMTKKRVKISVIQ